MKMPWYLSYFRFDKIKCETFAYTHLSKMKITNLHNVRHNSLMIYVMLKTLNMMERN